MDSIKEMSNFTNTKTSVENAKEVLKKNGIVMAVGRGGKSITYAIVFKQKDTKVECYIHEDRYDISINRSALQRVYNIEEHIRKTVQNKEIQDNIIEIITAAKIVSDSHRPFK